MGNITPSQRASALLRELERRDGPLMIPFAELQRRKFFRDVKEFNKLCNILGRRGREVLRMARNIRYDNPDRSDDWIYAEFRRQEIQREFQREFRRAFQREPHVHVAFTIFPPYPTPTYPTPMSTPATSIPVTSIPVPSIPATDESVSLTCMEG
jgi:hypothetical protein